MAIVVLNPLIGYADQGAGAPGYIGAATVGTSYSTATGVPPISSGTYVADVLAIPQMIPVGSGIVAGDFVAMQRFNQANGGPNYVNTNVELANFQVQQTLNTSTGAISPPLTVAAGSSGTTLNLNTSALTAGYDSPSGYIVIIHGTGAESNIFSYSYSGISGTTLTGVTPVFNDLLNTGGNVAISPALNTLTTGDLVLSAWNPPANSIITTVAAIMSAGQVDLSNAQICNLMPFSVSFGDQIPYSGTFPAFLYPNGSGWPEYESSRTFNSSLNTLGYGTPGNYTPGAIAVSISQMVTPPIAGHMPPGVHYGYISIQITDYPNQYLVGTSGTKQELRIGSVQMEAAVNLRPSVVMNGPISAAGTVTTTQPTFSWAYSDPEGDAQYSYRLVVFNTSDTALSGFNINDPSNYAGNDTWGLNGAETWGTAGATPVYDTGDVVGAGTAAQIPPGYLKGNHQYRVFVLVSDVVGRLLYNAVMVNSGTVTAGFGGTNAGLDFTTAAEAVLMPGINFPSTPNNPSLSFNPATGLIGPISIRSRMNLLTLGDADCGADGPSTWKYDPHNSVGTGTTPTVSSVSLSGGFYANAIVTSGWGTQTTSVAMISGAVPCQGGELLLGSVIASFSATGSHPTTGKAYLTFYSDTGTTILQTLVPVYGAIPVPTSSSTPRGNPGVFIVQCIAPYGTASVAIGMQFTLTTPASPSGFSFDVFRAAVTVNSINIMDDPSFASHLFGSLTVPTIVTGSSWYVENATGGSIVADTGVSYSLGTTAFSLPYNTSGTVASVHQTPLVPMLAADTHPWLVAADVKTNQPGASTIDIGIISGTGTIGPVVSVSPVAGSWYRQAGSVTPSLAGYFGMALPNIVTAGAAEATNFTVERQWTFTDGTFEKFTATGVSIPLTVGLGDYGTGTISAPGQWWQLGCPLITGASANTQAFNPHSGTNCLNMQFNGNNNVVQPVYVDVRQYFTVSGLTSISTSFWGYGIITLGGPPLGAFIQFYDNAGTVISVANTAGTVVPMVSIATSPSASFAYTNFTQSGIPVPATAAYAAIIFQIVNPGTTVGIANIDIDDVVLTLTGTIAPSTPWIDGGWSRGGLAPTITAGLLRSPDGVTFTGVRVAPNSIAASATEMQAGPGYEWDFYDYEFPVANFGTSETITYLGVSGGIATTQSPMTQSLLTNANGFNTTGWMLIDPLYPAGNIVIGIKDKVDFETDENQTVLMPMNRGRKVVLGDNLIFGDTITLPTLTTSNGDFSALKAMYSKTYPLLLRSPDGEMWYVRFTKRSRTRQWQGSYTRPFRTYSFTLEEVSPIP